MMHLVLLNLTVYALSCASTQEKPIEVEDSAQDIRSEEDSAVIVEEDSGDIGTSDTAEEISEPPPNLLRNAGFEAVDDSWNIWGGAQRVENNSYDGDWSLLATNGNGAEQLVEGLEPNTIYRLSGWAKTEGEEPILIGVKYYGGEEKRVSFVETEYQYQELTFTTGFGNRSAIVYAYKHSGTEASYADNLSLVYEAESTYAPIWSDEFDGVGALDSNKWNFEEGFVRNEELQWYQSENAFQEDGHLVIEGREEQRPNPNYVAGSSNWRTNRENIEYTSSSIRTKDLFDLMYGRIVVRAKVSNHTGTWPAIWTLGVDCQWPSNGEVDIMENYGGDILANFAWGTNQQWTPQWDSSHWPVSNFDPEWTSRFHIWELLWTPQRMTILLDGQELNTVDLSTTINGSAACEGQNPFQQPHYLLLNLALGGAGGSVENLSFPTVYVVDYVRIYQQ